MSRQMFGVPAYTQQSLHNLFQLLCLLKLKSVYFRLDNPYIQELNRMVRKEHLISFPVLFGGVSR